VSSFYIFVFDSICTRTEPDLRLLSV